MDKSPSWGLMVTTPSSQVSKESACSTLLLVWKVLPVIHENHLSQISQKWTSHDHRKSPLRFHSISMSPKPLIWITTTHRCGLDLFGWAGWSWNLGSIQNFWRLDNHKLQIISYMSYPYVLLRCHPSILPCPPCPAWGPQQGSWSPSHQATTPSTIGWRVCCRCHGPVATEKWPLIWGQKLENI